MPKVLKKSSVSRSAKEVVKRERKEVWQHVWREICDNDVLWWVDGGDKGRFVTECTQRNVQWLKKAITYGWLKCRDRRLCVDDESNTRDITFYLNTKAFYFERCCCEKKFLEDNEDELNDFRALLFLTDDEESSSDEEDCSSTDED